MQSKTLRVGSATIEMKGTAVVRVEPDPSTAFLALLDEANRLEEVAKRLRETARSIRGLAV